MKLMSYLHTTIPSLTTTSTTTMTHQGLVNGGDCTWKIRNFSFSLVTYNSLAFLFYSFLAYLPWSHFIKIKDHVMKEIK